MNKTILITGASSGIGKETAKLFQSKGWNVIATMRNPENETELNQLDNDFYCWKIDNECYVLDGKISRNSKIRIIRDGIVEYPKGEGQAAELGSLKRFKDDAKDVASNMECGLTIKNFSDLKVGDIVEAFEEEEVKRTL